MRFGETVPSQTADLLSPVPIRPRGRSIMSGRSAFAKTLRRDRYTPSPTKHFPPLLRRLVRAAQAECPPAQAEALVAFIGLALRKPAGRGRATSVVDPAIQSMARAHAEVDEMFAAWRRALAVATETSKQKDPADFYAGLAFGLVFVEPPAGTEPP
jgi:hypothetical protein